MIGDDVIPAAATENPPGALRAVSSACLCGLGISAAKVVAWHGEPSRPQRGAGGAAGVPGAAGAAFPSEVLPLNGIDGALMLLPRHRWSIDVVVTVGRAG
jgi:hypothetical protein